MKRLLCMSEEYEELKQQFIEMVEACEHPLCPECGSDDTGHGHSDPTFALPETDYLFCYECGHQWGFE